MTLSRLRPRAKTLSRVHSRIRLRVSASSISPSGARSVSMLPLTRSSPASELVKSRPVSAPRSSREKRSSMRSAPQRGGSRVAKPSAWTLPISPVSSVFTSSRESVPALWNRPRTSPRVFSVGNARRIPSKESGSSATSVTRPRVSNRVSRWTRPTATLGGRSPSRCRAVPWKVTLRSGPSSVPLAASRPSRITAGAMRRTVRRSTSELRTSKPVNTSPSPAAGADAAFAGDGAHRIARHPRVGERPVEPHVHVASRKPEPDTLPVSVPKNGSVSR